jgi:hypothetical protein
MLTAGVLYVHGQERDPPRTRAVGKRPAANPGGLRRVTSNGPNCGSADPLGAGPGVVLSSLGTLREPRSCSDRHEWQLCWSGRNGSAFFRDVPPGHYHIAPESFGRDFNQDRNVDLSPDQQLYVKIVSLGSWGMSVSGCKNCARDAFYAWLIPLEIAQAEIARDRTGI